MKILYFTLNLNSADNSGLPTYSESFIKNMKEEHEIIVFNIIVSNTDQDHETHDENRHDYWCRDVFSSYYPNVQTGIDSIIEAGVDIVFVQDYIMERYLEKYYKIQPFKKVFMVHLCQRGLMDSYTRQPFFDTFMAQSMPALSEKCWYEWKSILTSDTIITNSKFSTSEIYKYYGKEVSNKQIVTAPLGIDVESVPFIPCNTGKKWAYFGRLEAQKGLNYIIKDFVRYPELYKENPLIVIGDGTMDNQFIKADFFDGFVKFYGLRSKPELYEILKDVKYCIFPSIYEPWCLALNEALAMGKICIISDTGGGMHEQVMFLDNDSGDIVKSDGKRPDNYSFLNGLVLNFQNNSAVNFINTLEETTDPAAFPVMCENARESARKEKDHFIIIKEALNADNNKTV